MAQESPELAQVLAAEEPSRLMIALVDLWRVHRSPAIAELVDRLAEAIAPEVPDIQGGSLKEQQADFMARLQSLGPLDLTKVAAAIGSTNSKLAFKRVAATTKTVTEPDPRLSSALIRLIEDPPFRAKGSRDFWEWTFELLGRQEDPRTVVALQALLPRLNEHLGGSAWATRLFQKCMERVLEIPQPPHSEPPDMEAVTQKVTPYLAAFDRRMRSTARSAESAEPFLSAIADNPSDLHMRKVFADWLLEQADPRGRFMELQFAAEERKLTREEAKEQKALVAAHGATWLGALAPVLRKGSAVWELGFPVRATLGGFSKTTNYDEVTGHRNWRTFRELWNARGLWPAQLNHPVLREIQVLEDLRTDDLRTLLTATHPRALRRLVITRTDYRPLVEDDRTLFDAVQGLDQLQELHVPGTLASLQPLCNTRLLRQVRRWVIAPPGPHRNPQFDIWMAELPTVPPHLEWFGLKLHPPFLGYPTTAVVLAFRQSAPGVFSEASLIPATRRAIQTARVDRTQDWEALATSDMGRHWLRTLASNYDIEHLTLGKNLV